MSVVTPPDVELALTGYLRDALKRAGKQVQVSNKEPADLKLPLKKPLVVVRDDGGTQKSRISYTSRVGVTVLAGTRRNDKEANDLARLVYGILADPDIALDETMPFCSVDFPACTTPTAVIDNLDVARRYMTCEYIIVGEF